ncbi:hypothetical protein [Rhizobium binae]|uniref:hypothetical protein n=1 Tax=Rhizobium binae TaxID=1138190 RepID=UPI0031BB17E5
MLPLNPFEFGLGGFDRYTSLHACLVHLSSELGAKLLEEFRFHQVLVEPVQDARFKRVAADVEPVVARALRAGIGASEDVLGNHRITATAAAAFDQTGE